REEPVLPNPFLQPVSGGGELLARHEFLSGEVVPDRLAAALVVLDLLRAYCGGDERDESCRKDRSRGHGLLLLSPVKKSKGRTGVRPLKNTRTRRRSERETHADAD